MLQIIDFKKLGYVKTPTIIEMISSLEEEFIFNKLILVQQHELLRIKEIINSGKILRNNFVCYLKNLYFNYVLKINNKPIIKKEIKTEEHIGMKIFKTMCT